MYSREHHRHHHLHHHSEPCFDPRGIRHGRGHGRQVPSEGRDVPCEGHDIRFGGHDIHSAGRPMRHFGGRRARKGALRESILRLLSDQSLNGYQIMTAIGEKTADQWRPSPGAIYPCLSQLVDEGLILAVDADGQKVFELTDAGREAVAGVSEEPWADGSRPDHSRAVWVQVRALAETVRLAGTTGTPEQVSAIAEELDKTRKTVLAILADAK